jgi:hypothetical protein
VESAGSGRARAAEGMGAPASVCAIPDGSDLLVFAGAV